MNTFATASVLALAASLAAQGALLACGVVLGVFLSFWWILRRAFHLRPSGKVRKTAQDAAPVVRTASATPPAAINYTEASLNPQHRAEAAAAKALATLAQPRSSPAAPPPLLEEEGKENEEEQQQQQQEGKPQLTELKEPTDNFAYELKNPARHAKLQVCVKLLTAWANEADQRGEKSSLLLSKRGWILEEQALLIVVCLISS